MGSLTLATGWHRLASRWLRALIFALAGLAGGSVLAQTQGERAEYAPGNVEFRLPDKWSVETGKQKLTLVAPNEDGFIQFSTLLPGTDGQLRAQAAQALTISLSDLVLADPGDGISINGMPGFRVTGTGASDATTVQFVAVALSPTPAKPILVLAYASQESFATHAPVFEALIKSLKRR